MQASGKEAERVKRDVSVDGKIASRWIVVVRLGQYTKQIRFDQMLCCLHLIQCLHQCY